MKIELAAQDWLMDHFENMGWDVRDTHIGNPYDAVATHRREVLYLEAKGTTTNGDSVIVTRNEVRWARQDTDGSCSACGRGWSSTSTAKSSQIRATNWSSPSTPTTRTSTRSHSTTVEWP